MRALCHLEIHVKLIKCSSQQLKRAKEGEEDEENSLQNIHSYGCNVIEINEKRGIKRFGHPKKWKMQDRKIHSHSHGRKHTLNSKQQVKWKWNEKFIKSTMPWNCVWRTMIIATEMVTSNSIRHFAVLILFLDEKHSWTIEYNSICWRIILS